MPDLDLVLKPSRLYFLLQALLLAITLVTIYLIDGPIWLKTLLVLLITGVVLQGCHAEACFRRIVTNDREWTVILSDKRFSGTLCGDSTVTAAIMILRFGIEHRKRKVSVVLFRDTLDRESWRRLSVLARHRT